MIVRVKVHVKSANRFSNHASFAFPGLLYTDHKSHEDQECEAL